MKTDNKQKEEVTLERRICDRCRDVDGLTFGYIGNFESWGDDRKLFIWINEDEMREARMVIKLISGSVLLAILM